MRLARVMAMIVWIVSDWLASSRVGRGEKGEAKKRSSEGLGAAEAHHGVWSPGVGGKVA
jgi:hypothetical protein